MQQENSNENADRKIEATEMSALYNRTSKLEKIPIEKI